MLEREKLIIVRSATDTWSRRKRKTARVRVYNIAHCRAANLTFNEALEESMRLEVATPLDKDIEVQFI